MTSSTTSALRYGPLKIWLLSNSHQMFIHVCMVFAEYYKGLLHVCLAQQLKCSGTCTCVGETYPVCTGPSTLGYQLLPNYLLCSVCNMYSLYKLHVWASPNHEFQLVRACTTSLDSKAMEWCLFPCSGVHIWLCDSGESG